MKLEFILIIKDHIFILEEDLDYDNNVFLQKRIN